MFIAGLHASKSKISLKYAQPHLPKTSTPKSQAASPATTGRSQTGAKPHLPHTSKRVSPVAPAVRAQAPSTAATGRSQTIPLEEYDTDAGDG